MSAQSDEFIPTQTSLLRRLKSWDDQESWKRFFETYWKLIYNVARKAGLNDADAQDVVQETVVSVARQMPGFKYNPELGSFKGWLAQLSRRRIIDHLRKRQYQHRGVALPREQRLNTTLMEDPAHAKPFDLEASWDDEWNNHAMETALEKAKRQVSPAHFQMFQFHVIKGRPAKEVAQLLEVKLAEVYFAKKKVTKVVQKEIKSLERKRDW